jgi:hypothetical protein
MIPDDQSEPLDELMGPHLELRVTKTRSVRATTLWEDLKKISAEGDTSVALDWNGINARNWDMSFVPWR